MAYVVIKDGEVIGVFANPQPHLDGYSEIADDDALLQEFYNKQVSFGQ